MHSFAPIRFAAVATLALSASLLAHPPQATQTKPAAPQPASTLPAPQPTTPEQPAGPLPPSPRPPDDAHIPSSDGTLFVSADNSSLNQILREIARDTGMKITGGVADERVFGHYGPAPTDQILSALLDGTGSNMLLLY